MNKQLSYFDNKQSMLSLSIDLLKEFEQVALSRNPRGYIVGYSGGKDSDAMLEVFKESGVKFFVIHNHTTLDAPETVYYIRKKFSLLEAEGIPCKIHYSAKTFWSLCRHKMALPTRLMRFCCSELKEKQIPEYKFATHSFGVRKAESVKRAAKRDSIETRNRTDYSDIKTYHFDNTEDLKATGACYTNNYFIVNPIVYWSDNYLWDFIEGNNLEINPLYQRGFKRVGCIGCPMAGKHRLEEFRQYPIYKNNYLRLCNEIMQERILKKLPNKMNFKNGGELFEWWMESTNNNTEDLPIFQL